MKKSIVLIVLIVVLGLVLWNINGKKSSETLTPITPSITQEPTVSVPVSEIVKVSDKLSEYKNEELGFSIKYPSVWENVVSDNGILFTIPTGKPDTNTIGKLDIRVSVVPGKCSFPPVTTIKDRSTLKSGSLSFPTISMSNSVQGRTYFDRMYSLQNQNTCYLFHFSSISLSPASKGIKGSEATKIANNNKALVDSADQAFTDMIKSFAYVVGEVGKDETLVVPIKK